MGLFDRKFCDICGQTLNVTETAPALGHIDEDEDNRCDNCGLFLGVVTVYFVDTLDWVPENDYTSDINFYAFGTGTQSHAWHSYAALSAVSGNTLLVAVGDASGATGTTYAFEYSGGKLIGR